MSVERINNDISVYHPLKNTSRITDILKTYFEPFNINAVFSDETANFVSNSEPDINETIKIRLRCATNDCDSVFVIANGVEYPMEREPETAGYIFDYYFAEINIGKSQLSYYFMLSRGGNVYYYNKRGLYATLDPFYNHRLIPGFKTPDWAKGAVYYQIFVDRFYNGDEANDVRSNEYAYLGRAAKHIDDWYEPVKPDDVCRFYGGDLRGVINKLDYIESLGVEAIYLNPIFVSPSSHKYDVQDYENVDPHFGVITNDGGSCLEFERFSNEYATKYIKRTTDAENLRRSNELLADLISAAHKRGIRVILDGVFNHCGAFNRWLDRESIYQGSETNFEPGAFHAADSPYHSFFKWFGGEWPGNAHYDCWWGHENHPKLNYEGSEKLYSYIMEIAAKWVSPPYNADGWRLDVAADLGYSPEFNHRFWRNFVNSVKRARPDAIILAEHYGSAEEWLKGGEWDTVMNYDAFMEPVTWFFTGMEKHSDYYRQEQHNNAMSFETVMRHYESLLPIQSRQTAMNELSNHDHSRFLTRTNLTAGKLGTHGHLAASQNINVNVFLSAIVLYMTWTGCPTVYYGDEAGLCGWTDPDNRRPYPWGRENNMLIELHKYLIRLRKQSSALRTGSLEYLFNDYGVLSYGRWSGEEKIVVIINNNSYNRKTKIPVYKAEIVSGELLERVCLTGNDSFDTTPEYCKITDGILEIMLGAYSSAVFIKR